MSQKSGVILILGNPRSGTTYFNQLLSCHCSVSSIGEPLSDETSYAGDPLAHIDNLMLSTGNRIVVMKCFPEQLQSHNVRLDDLVQHLHCNNVAVVWRRDSLEMFVSRKIADMTGEWYSNEKPTKVHSVTVDEEEFLEFTDQIKRKWVVMGSQWPIKVVPSFYAYEDIVNSGKAFAASILESVNLDLKHTVFKSYMHRQNPASLAEKIINWAELSDQIKQTKVDVPTILAESIASSTPVPREIMVKRLLPDKEPQLTADGWLYRVAEPYLPVEASRNVVDSVYGRCVSSAGYWPKELADRLCNFFGCPLAQPCANGFCALVLALQAANVGVGDEVVIPAFTMIAVPNSVHFVGATPIVVDNDDDSYNPSVKQILAAATEKTKAVIVTHTYGVPMTEINELAAVCSDKNWILIEDIAEAVGIHEKKTGKLLGTFGDFACASMYANKILHGGDGGFVIAASSQYETRLVSLVNHGFRRTFHFFHLEPAVNAKINGMGAALAIGVLDNMDKIMDHRRSICKHYRRRLSSTPLKLMPECGKDDTPWVFGAECETSLQKNALRRHLADYRIETRNFFTPIHLQPASEKMCGAERRSNIELPVSEKMGYTGFYLPLYTDLTSADIDYICDVVVSFFDPTWQVREAPNKEPLLSITVQPDTFDLKVVEYDRNGYPQNRNPHGHPLISAVVAKRQIRRHVKKERWDERQKFMKCISNSLRDGDKIGLNLQEVFQPLLTYCKDQGDFEPDVRRFWISKNIDDDEFGKFSHIPTTTDRETLQFLMWLIEKKEAKVILEVGGWLGRASCLMGVAARKNTKPGGAKPLIYVLDAFRWQKWMNVYWPQNPFHNDESFLENFLQNTAPLGETVQPREWNAGDKINHDLIPERTQFDVVFLDFATTASETEEIWKEVKPYCDIGHTIIVCNAYPPSVAPFFANHRDELQPIVFKPHTIARAYLYAHDQSSANNHTNLKRKLAFCKPPDWHHHHKNAFLNTISKLEERFHDEKAETAFLPAVEDYFCDHVAAENMHRPWIGIVHEVPHREEAFYYPDLHRLCTGEHYRSALTFCRGLFTLTELQAKYLRMNLPKKLAIPINQLIYPTLIDNGAVSNLFNCDDQSTIQLVFIGSFARDIDLFYNAIVPKNVKKILLAGDDQLKKWAEKAPDDVQVIDRLDDDKYDNLLSNCVAFLSLKVDGAANTLIVECIARNVPILAPRWASSCVEYLGDLYPLFYDLPQEKNQLNLTQLLIPNNIHAGINYLLTMEKSKFQMDHFLKTFQESSVMLNVVPMVENRVLGASIIPEMQFPTFDITICICSYKRTHHLAELLSRLWSGQNSFKGSMQIIIWNNNEARRDVVNSICKKYIAQPNASRRLELIQSTQNYYCAIRACTPALMRSDKLLICDDDIMPQSDFVQFFYSASQRYPEDVLCARGHNFMEHKLDPNCPESTWKDYKHLRFINDNQPMQFVHFAHADACLIPKAALHEWASVEMPDPTFALIDDYWMSFVLNSQFGRNMRKLWVSGDGAPPFQRTDDSDVVGLALHTRPEVIDARVRLYIHHMLRGWPVWPKLPSIKEFPEDQRIKLQDQKRSPWKNAFVGFNVSSKLSQADANDLVKMGVRNVRIGVVGVKKAREFELSGFNSRPQRQMDCLLECIDMLAQSKINVVITLSHRIDLADAWALIAKHCWSRPNVIGYDLINEPFTEAEYKNGRWSFTNEIDDSVGDTMLREKYLQLIRVIEKEDTVTPIILESSCWAHPWALPSLNNIFQSFSECVRSRLLMSYHFYEPYQYTRRRLNQGRYEYPCEVPMWSYKWSSKIDLNKNWIKDELATATKWALRKPLPNIIIGEAGVARDMPGASKYLRDVLQVAFEVGSPTFLYAFRDPDWEAMDYEKEFEESDKKGTNEFMPVIIEAIKRANEAVDISQSL